MPPGSRSPPHSVMPNTLHDSSIPSALHIAEHVSATWSLQTPPNDLLHPVQDEVVSSLLSQLPAVDVEDLPGLVKYIIGAAGSSNAEQVRLRCSQLYQLGRCKHTAC